MILPGTEKLEGVIGTTFDMTVVLYPTSVSQLKWQKPVVWSEEKVYKKNSAVLGEDSKSYRAIVENENINPVEDKSGHWELIPPLNIEGYSAEFDMGELKLKTGEGITLGGKEGTVKIKAKYKETVSFLPGNSHFSLWLTDSEENKYEYLQGNVKWKNP